MGAHYPCAIPGTGSGLKAKDIHTYIKNHNANLENETVPTLSMPPPLLACFACFSYCVHLTDTIASTCAPVQGRNIGSTLPRIIAGKYAKVNSI